MACRNEKKKMTFEDKFARNNYCKHARLGSIREDKKRNAKEMRQINKKIIKKSLDNE